MGFRYVGKGLLYGRQFKGRKGGNLAGKCRGGAVHVFGFRIQGDCVIPEEEKRVSGDKG